MLAPHTSPRRPRDRRQSATSELWLNPRQWSASLTSGLKRNFRWSRAELSDLCATAASRRGTRALPPPSVPTELSGQRVLWSCRGHLQGHVGSFRVTQLRLAGEHRAWWPQRAHKTGRQIHAPASLGSFRHLPAGSVDGVGGGEEADDPAKPGLWGRRSPSSPPPRPAPGGEVSSLWGNWRCGQRGPPASWLSPSSGPRQALLPACSRGAPLPTASAGGCQQRPHTLRS